MASSGEAQGQADASSQTAGGERVDEEGWGSPNTSAPVILISTGTPARVKPYSFSLSEFVTIHNQPGRSIDASVVQVTIKDSR